MVYKVKNMSCLHCVNRIQTTLNNHGISAVVDLASKTVQADDERLPAILKAIGYEVE